MAVRATSTATVLDVMRRSAFDGSSEAPGAVSVAWPATAWAEAKIISSLTFAARETMTPKPRPGYSAALFACPRPHYLKECTLLCMQEGGSALLLPPAMSRAKPLVPSPAWAVLTPDNCGHPVRRATRRSGLDRFALEVMKDWNRRKALTIVQAVHIDNRPCSLRHLRDCRNEDTATAADQKIAGAGSEAVILYQRPVVSPDLEKSFRIRNDARAVAATERAGASPQRNVF